MSSLFIGNDQRCAGVDAAASSAGGNTGTAIPTGGLTATKPAPACWNRTPECNDCSCHTLVSLRLHWKFRWQNCQLSVARQEGDGAASAETNHNHPLDIQARMNVLLVEDDASLSDGIARTLAGAGHAVDARMSGVEALEATRQERFDLVLLDIGLPGIDGYEVLRRLRAAEDATPVLVLSARDQIGDRVHGLDLGADDYLAKPFAMAELGARIRALLRRAQVQASPRITHGPLTMDRAARRTYLSGERLELTAREWAVLEILLQKAEKIVSKESILHHVASWDDHLSTNAIEVYISRLRAKLEPAGIRIRTVRGFGYMLEPFGKTN